MLARLSSIGFGTVIAALLMAAPAAGRSDEPLARFEDRICPGVMGLRKDAAETMVGLIRGNLEALGIDTEDGSLCEPNLVVGFVEDGQAFLKRMAAKNGNPAFIEISRHERLALLAETGPSRTLLRVHAHTRDGLTISRREDLVAPSFTTMAVAHSKIYTATRNDIVAALVLIDRSEARGLSVAQLADYATFRALTRTLPPAEARGELIVGLFDPGTERPAGLTEFDRAFLTTLYAGLPNLPGTARLAALTHATGHEFAGTE